MNVTIETQGERLRVVRLSGRLDAAAAPDLRERLRQLVRHGVTHLVVDLAGTRQVDRFGLDALVDGWQQSRSVGGDLRIVGATPLARVALHLSGLKRVLPPYGTVEDALFGFEPSTDPAPPGRSTPRGGPPGAPRTG